MHECATGQLILVGTHLLVWLKPWIGLHYLPAKGSGETIVFCRRENLSLLAVCVRVCVCVCVCVYDMLVAISNDNRQTGIVSLFE